MRSEDGAMLTCEICGTQGADVTTLDVHELCPICMDGISAEIEIRVFGDAKAIHSVRNRTLSLFAAPGMPA